MRKHITRVSVDVRLYDKYIEIGFTHHEAIDKIKALEFRSELNYITLTN